MGKKIIIIILVTGLLAIAFIFNPLKETAPPPSVGGDEFILGAMNSFRDYSREEVTDPDKFGMNLWHRYSGSQHDVVTDKWYPSGWTPADTLFADYNTYIGSVKDTLELNESHGMKTLMHRPKIE